MGKDELIQFDTFGSFNPNIAKEKQIVQLESTFSQCANGGRISLLIPEDLDCTIYTADGSKYLQSNGKQTKIGEDKALVRKAIDRQRELLKKYKIDKYNKVTKQFEFSKDEKSK